MTVIAMVLHKSYMTRFSTLISCYANVFSFILIFTNNWLPYCAMAFRIVFVYWLSHKKLEINNNNNLF